MRCNPPDRRRRRVVEPGPAIARGLPLPGRTGIRVRAGQSRRDRGARRAGVRDPGRRGGGDRAGSTWSTSSGGPSCASRTPARRSRPAPAACGCSSASSTGKPPPSPTRRASRSSWTAARPSSGAGSGVPGGPRLASADEEPEEDQHESGDRDQSRVLGLPAQDLHARRMRRSCRRPGSPPRHAW